MKATEALKLMFTHENIESIMLPGSGKNRKTAIVKANIKYTGIHINALEMESDRWLVGITLDSDMPPNKREVIWKKYVN